MSDAEDWANFEEATLLTILEHSEEGLLVFDSDGICRMVGTKIGKFFGIEPKALVGKPRPEVLVTLGNACEEPNDFMSTAASDDLGDPPRVLGDLEIRIPKRLLTWAMYPIERGLRKIGRFVVVRDVTRERNAERTRRLLLQRIEQLTPLDALTGLANRRRFTEEHEREHGRALRAWDTYGVLMLDVDGMRAINESFGVPVGDAVLERVAELAKQGRREYDVVARMQNDEFAILLPGADGVALHAVAQRIRGALGAGERRPDTPNLSVAIGGAVCAPPTGETASDIVRRCSEALERARARGTSELEIDIPAPTSNAPSQVPPA
ncbi:MAG: sensor domain-containing diguanylate cyclase [Deltaproteobacteria bacterium]|nr:sensor domain-containing diguanylate cyclase [Deltaproteobacteria bacterium]